MTVISPTILSFGKLVTERQLRQVYRILTSYSLDHQYIVRNAENVFPLGADSELNDAFIVFKYSLDPKDYLALIEILSARIEFGENLQRNQGKDPTEKAWEESRQDYDYELTGLIIYRLLVDQISNLLVNE